MTDLDCMKLMVTLQDKFNTKTIGEDWKKRRDIKWLRAVWVECGELIQYIPWEWWKTKSQNKLRATMELVDIWHFGISEVMRFFENKHEFSIDNVSETLLVNWNNIVEYKYDIPVLVDGLVYYAIGRSQETAIFDVPIFSKIAKQCKLNLCDLTALYLAKNALNIFRQEQGYKDGKYNKYWTPDVEDSDIAYGIGMTWDKYDELTELTMEAMKQALYHRYRHYAPIKG